MPLEGWFYALVVTGQIKYLPIGILGKEKEIEKHFCFEESCKKVMMLIGIHILIS